MHSLVVPHLAQHLPAFLVAQPVLVFVDHGSDREPDHSGIMLCGLAPHRLRKACQPTFRCLQKLLALPCPLLGQRRIAASHEPFAGKVGRGDLCQIALVEQGGESRAR